MVLAWSGSSMLLARQSEDSGGQREARATLIPPATPLTVGVGAVVQVVVPELEPAFTFYQTVGPMVGAELRHLGSVPFIDQDGGRSRIERLELLPLEPGTIRLPALEFRSGNRQLTSRALDLPVVAPEADERMVLDLALSHAEAFVGQPVLLSGFWSPGYDIEQIVAVDFQLPLLRRGEVSVSLPPEQDFRQRGVIGLPFSNRRIPARLSGGALEFSVVVVPREAGDLEIEPASLLASIIDEPSPRRRSGFQYPAYFDNQFFRDPGDETGRRVFVRSQPLALRVRPLPDGAPDSFTGAVGSFSAGATVSPASLDLGGVATLTLTLDDHPHPRGLELPPLERQPAFRSAFSLPGDDTPPAIEGGRAVFRRALRPLDADIDRVPAVLLSYFDPVAERYVEVQTDPLPLEVRPASGVGAAVMSDGRRLATPLQPSPPGLGENASWEQLLGPPGWHERLRPGGGTSLAWWLALLPMAVFAICWQRCRARQPGQWARRRKAWRRLVRRWRRATAEREPARMVDRLRPACSGFLRERFGLSTPVATDPEGVRQWAREMGPLQQRSCESQLIDLADLWQQLDQLRYHRCGDGDAPTSAATNEQLQRLTADLRRVLLALHRSRLPMP